MKVNSNEVKSYLIKFMLKFSSIPQGKGFGELALLENKPRSATVLALGEVWCAVLYKGAYDTILK